MTRQMFRYVVPIDDRPYAFLLTGGPVAVAAGDRSIEFWAEHADDGSAVKRWFQVFGTGHPLPEGARWAGTCPRTPAGLVWHLYELAPKPNARAVTDEPPPEVIARAKGLGKLLPAAGEPS
jgi:hypothetical protein